MKLSVLTLLTFTGALVLVQGSTGLRGERGLEGTCGDTVCNERVICQDGACNSCRTGFKNPPYCEDINECVEQLNPPPCAFYGAVCVDETPILDGSSVSRGYKCACRTKEGWLDGPVSDKYGPTSCAVADGCSNSPCPLNASCSNRDPPESFVCNCNGDLIFNDQGNCVEKVEEVELVVGGPCAAAKDCEDNPFSTCDAFHKKCVCIAGYFQGTLLRMKRIMHY
jgi:hypothetical protein